ncbi:MAG TPA: SUMF1/EgtB/PvdO family nonheme iron enzyme [Candidatus Acidoferrales bacterium]|nr:SUMF1/EgtB/PvdO family nonheme iron enzyme [Candidatus Acidoferrales bacterium]
MTTAPNAVSVGHDLLERMSDARRKSDELFRVVKADSLYERPIPERHRIIFYVGHLEAFDWNLLHERLFGLKSFHPEFDRLFAFGIDPVGGGLPSDQPSDWPSLQSVRDYVAGIRSALDQRLADGIPESITLSDVDSNTLLNVAIEHRLMHVETLAYMLHQLPLDRKVRQVDAPLAASAPVAHRKVSIPSGQATLGLPGDGATFGWDNEFEIHTADVPEFEIDRYMVTNAQYLEFMQSGGYETRDFWSDDDWNWKESNGIAHPVFWKKAKGQWLYRTMFDEIPLPLDWPVYVSHAEASAYARWAGKALPTEQEWHRAAYGSNEGRERLYPWGREAADPNFGNFDFNRWDPAPVNAFPAGRSAFGVEGLLGNGWEWSSTVFAPFQGFAPFPFYRGYSADFFDGKHFVMKGGSARTGACMLRPTFRNWFQSHYQYVYTGFRCVER